MTPEEIESLVDTRLKKELHELYEQKIREKVQSEARSEVTRRLAQIVLAAFGLVVVFLWYLNSGFKAEVGRVIQGNIQQNVDDQVKESLKKHADTIEDAQKKSNEARDTAMKALGNADGISERTQKQLNAAEKKIDVEIQRLEEVSATASTDANDAQLRMEKQVAEAERTLAEHSERAKSVADAAEEATRLQVNAINQSLEAAKQDIENLEKLLSDKEAITKLAELFQESKDEQGQLQLVNISARLDDITKQVESFIATEQRKNSGTLQRIEDDLRSMTTAVNKITAEALWIETIATNSIGGRELLENAAAQRPAPLVAAAVVWKVAAAPLGHRLGRKAGVAADVRGGRRVHRGDVANELLVDVVQLANARLGRVDERRV